MPEVYPIKDVNGVDSLTQKEAEGVHCKFADGTFQGFLSWKSLRMLLTMRQQQDKPQEK